MFRAPADGVLEDRERSIDPYGPLARDDGGAAGQTLTITGLVAAVSAPLVVSVSGRLDRRLVLVALMGLLGAANLLAAWSPVFAVMVAARVLVGVAMGGGVVVDGLGPAAVPFFGVALVLAALGAMALGQSVP